MQLLHKMEFEPAKFTNYFLGFPVSDQDSKSAGPLRREGVLELCHNWGTESDDSFSGYHNGNKSPQGFGHLAITCDDIEKTCAYFEEKQVKFQKNLNDGQLKGIDCSATSVGTHGLWADPDGYWIAEILVPDEVKTACPDRVMCAELSSGPVYQQKSLRTISSINRRMIGNTQITSCAGACGKSAKIIRSIRLTNNDVTILGNQRMQQDLTVSEENSM
ncbi:hypothetical protein PSTT_13613 [Puccinia striiformis]|uniref:VOC domain-containing protein n=1 Tax=Puccinia striiformis TaxID=27350 RepID=A0A2S4URB5_9BASI|nr:hypothetical protein PSTT_13613 [Puccinia striiformis]